MRIRELTSVLVEAVFIVVLVVWAVSMSRVAAAPVAPLTVSGRLVATEEDVDAGAFTLESDEPITLTVAEGSYIHDYMQGSVGHVVRVTIQPDPPR